MEPIGQTTMNLPPTQGPTTLRRRPAWRGSPIRGLQTPEGYTIKRGIGHGGFGEVYYATSDAGKEVALKLIAAASMSKFEASNSASTSNTPTSCRSTTYGKTNAATTGW